MGLAHADAAVEKKRVICLGRTLGDRLASGMSKLVPAADHEGVEGIAWVQLSGAVPVEAGLGVERGCGRRLRPGSAHGEATVVPDRSVRRVILGGDKFYVLVVETEVINRFLNQVGVLVSHGAELCGRNAHEKHSLIRMTVAGRFQPGVVGVAINFFFERIEDAHPRVRDDGGTGNRHCFKKYTGRRLGRVREKSDLSYEFFFTAEQFSLLQLPVALMKTQGRRTAY